MNENIFVDNGSNLTATVDSYGDHRIAMTMLIAALVCQDNVLVKNTECIKTSFPNFMKIFGTHGVTYKVIYE